MSCFKAIDPCSGRPAYGFTTALLILAITASLCVRPQHASGAGSSSAQNQEEPKLVISILSAGSQGSPSTAKPKVLKTVAFDLSEYFAASAAARDTALVREFKHNFQAAEGARLKIENRSGREVSFILFKAEGKDKVSVIYPSQEKDYYLAPSYLEAGQSVETGPLGTSAQGGEETYKLLIGHLGSDLDMLVGISNSRSVRDPGGLRGSMTNIGGIFTTSGDTVKSVDYYDLILAIRRSLKNRRAIESEALTLNNRGIAHYITSNFEKAIKDYREALELLDRGPAASSPYAELWRARLKSALLSNLGQVYSSLGSFSLALKNYSEALDIKNQISDEQGKAIVLNNMGTVYSAQRNYSNAEKYFLESLPLAEREGMSRVRATGLGNLAQIYLALNQPKKATDYALESISLSQKIGNRLSEGLARNNLGTIYVEQKRYEEAIAQYEAAVRLFQAEGNRVGEAIVYSNLMFAFKEYQRPLMAIAYGKWSVNLLQQIRRESGGLEKDLQKSFITSRGDTYRELADLLISKGRIPEAERVLEMLKEEELLQYTLRDKAVAGALSKRTDLSARERKAVEDYAGFADQITALSREMEELELEQSKLALDAPFPKQARYDELKAKFATAMQAFLVFERQLEEELGKNNWRIEQLNIGLQEKLKSWKSPNTVIISTIVGPKRSHVIVTTTGAPESHTIEISEAELNRLIKEFRSAITDPCACLDPRPAGQKLYDLLIKPIEGDLAGARAQTLVWSLDGALRYIPIAALWDGQHYLVERFQNVIITLASIDKLAARRDQPVTSWRALGAGVSKKRGEEFPALAAVPQELKNVVRQDNAPNPSEENGVIPGLRLLDDAFKRDIFERARGRFSVIHIASHFDFRPEGEGASALLLGDGLLTLTEVFSSGTMFSGVELLTLSACNTATGGNGTEVEGFGGLAQGRGAKAVLASLWAVADESTGVLMRQFYRNLRDNPEMTKAEAIRQAQLDLLKGRVEVPRPGIEGLREKNNDKTNGAQMTANFVPDPKSPRAHPYYWAPFILMGNWK